MEPGKETSILPGTASRVYSQLRSAAGILAAYHGTEPFHSYLKKYFSKNKKHGSKDRKLITSFCYSFFRVGHAVSKLPFEERILLGYFLSENADKDVLSVLKPGWDQAFEKPLLEKLEFLKGKIEFDVADIFPFADELDEKINLSDFNLSFLIQPRLYLRIRPGKLSVVAGKLKNAGILPEWISENTAALPNGSKIESLIQLDNEAVVQDISSQRVQELMQIPLRQKPHGSPATDIKKVWDCCAASGGKSIMAFDINNSIQLSVSDKRSSALDTCRQRFKKAGITSYHDFIADLTQKNFVFPGYPRVNDTADIKLDLVIADVPCTGSGTWSRTPEQLFYFNPSEIKRYSTLQRQILRNVIPTIKSGGYLLYITCSVFKEENEEIVDYLVQEFSLKLNRMELLEGYRTRADTLFAALFSIA